MTRYSWSRSSEATELFQPVFSIGEPFEIEAREHEVRIGSAARFVEAKNRSVFCHGQVAVSAGAQLQYFVHRPSPAFVVSKLERKIFSVAPFAGGFLAVRAIQVMRVRKHDAVLVAKRLFRDPHDARHANRFEQCVIEPRLRPTGPSVV